MERRANPARWAGGRFRRRWERPLARLGLLVVGLIGLAWLLWTLAGVYVEWAWFDSLGHTAVLARQLETQAALFLGGGALFAAAYAATLRLGRRLEGGASGAVVGEEGLWAYLARVSAGLRGDATRARHAERSLAALGAGLALVFGLWAGDGWMLWLIALNATPFGLTDPLFGRDVAFYVFTLPLLRALLGWLVAAVGALGLATLLAYLARGHFELGLSPRGALAALNRPARLHLAAFGAGLLVLAAAHHQLALAELVLARSGQAFGLTFPGYVAANAQAPALWAMSVAAVIAAALLVRAAPSGRPKGLALGPLVWIAALILGMVYPALVQALVLKPNEAVLERPYLAQVASLTRAAYGLDGLIERDVEVVEPLGPETVREQAATLTNLRLWDAEPIRNSLNQLQAFRPYYGFSIFPDLDRYTLGGQNRALFVAARELDVQQLPVRTWVTSRLQFTHGYGLVAAAASGVGGDGRPLLVERDLPPQGELPLTRPEIYFGERTTEPALVRTSEAEIDYPRGEDVVQTRYQGDGGVPIGSLPARLAHAARLGDLLLLLSPTIGPETQLLHRRQIAERVQRLAPYLLLDADPYPVVHEGRLIWMLDGYTASDRFPFAPRANGRLLAADPRSPGAVRQVESTYLRAAVKATVDAYDGSVRLYLADPRDPIAATYARIYPSLFQPLEVMPVGLRAHLRYPQQLFAVQGDVLARFHVSDPGRLYSGEDAWLVAPGRLTSRPDARPSYAVQRLPGEANDEFVLTLPFRPFSQAGDRQNLVAILAARSDSPHYGELVLYRYPKDRPVEGPLQAEARISQDPAVSAQMGLWQRSGAQIIQGDLQTIPLGRSVLYLESIYLQRSDPRSDRSAFPELQRVVAVAGGRVAMEPTLEAALSSLIGAQVDLARPGQPAPTGEPRPDRLATARELALSAQEHLQRAQEALFAGDRARHEQELRAALADLQRLAETTR